MAKEELQKIYDALATDSEKEQLLLSEKISLLEKTVQALIDGQKLDKESEGKYQDAVVSGFTELGKSFDKLRLSNSTMSNQLGEALTSLASKFDNLGKTISVNAEGNQKDFALTLQNIVAGLSGVSQSIADNKPVWRWPQYLYSGLRDTSFSPINPRKEDGHGSTSDNPSYVSGTVSVSGIVVETGTVTVSFPAVQAVSGSVSITSGSVSVNNFPTVQAIQGTVSVSGLDVVIGTVSISNLPTNQTTTISGGTSTVNQGTSPWVIIGTTSISTGTVAISQGTITVNQGTVNIANTPAVTVNNGTVTVSTGTVAISYGSVYIIGTIPVHPVTVVGSVSITAGTLTVQQGTVTATQGGYWAIVLNAGTAQIGAVTGSVSITAGTVAVSQGTVVINTGSNTIGTVTINNLQAGTVVLNNSSNTIGTVTINNLQAGTVTLNTGGNIIGTVTVNNVQAGTVILNTASNTIGTVTINRQFLIASLPNATAVTSTSGTALASNSSRRGLVLTNAAGGTTMFLGLGGTAAVWKGISLAPNGTWTMDAFTFTNQAIHAIAGATSSLTIQEFS